MNIQFTDKQELPNLRVITWYSQKGNKCELTCYLQQKEYMFTVYDKNEDVINDHNYKSMMDAIIGLVNVVITERAKKSKEDWWDKQHNFTERFFARFFNWK